MAKVFEGTDTVLGRTVAIKVLAPQFADDQSFVERFRREAQAAARIGQQQVVSVFDTGSDDGVHYIVMEYVEGRTLAEFLAGGGRIMPDRAIGIAQDVCRALEAAHAQGVIHRDIKPGNIMMSPRGEVKVADFGIARVTTTNETLAQTAAILGTASYLSPEQAQGQPVDGRSDIYSLGCVLYEMVTGRPPFLGDTPVAVASKQVLEQPVPPSTLNPDVTPELDAVILRALSKNPANRYQSAEEFRADLDRAQRGLPVEAAPLLAVGATQVLDRPDSSQATQVLPGPEPERRSPWVPIVVTIVLVALLGLLLWFLATTLLGDDEPGTGDLVTVPNVVGDRLNAARAELEEANLVVVDENIVRVPAPADDPEAAPGTVLEQDPAADEQVEEGTEVVLTVVAQPEAIPIPTVVGLQASAAQLILEQAGFLTSSRSRRRARTIPTGSVTRTEPAEGTEALPGDTITLFVSSGTGTVVVPPVTCQSFGSAQRDLREAGLNPIPSAETRPLNPLCHEPEQGGCAGTCGGHGGAGRLRRVPVPRGGRGPHRPDRPHGTDGRDRRRLAVSLWFVHEEFTDEERSRLAPYFTNLDGPVFALLNLPEVVKGALFARYSRTGKSLRRLFLDEFAEQVEGAVASGTEGVKVDKAEQLYERVFFDFGDDSVAQLGGVHLACEQVSQLLAKAIEWGRLAAYLEQSTRYMRYDDRPGGRWRLTVPPEISGTPVEDAYLAYADRTFETYGRLFQPLFDLFAERFPKDPADPEFLYRSTITAKTCDTLRELLPAGTRSNLGVYATGQSYEQMLLRMRAHPLAEVREYADLMLVELRTVIPAFLRRVDLEDRGVAWSRYLAETRGSTDEVASKFTGGAEPEPRELVTLTDFDPLGEEKVVAAALYAATDLPDDQLRSLAHAMSEDEREAVLRAYVGDRANRRHKPGRAFERTDYRFDVLCDYGAFRDLQRHRPLTLEWQTLAPTHGYDYAAGHRRGRDDVGVGRRHAGLGGDVGDPRRARRR